MKKVLVIGRHTFMLESILQLLQENRYDSIGATQNEQAVKLFEDFKPDAVVIGGGVDLESRDYFHKHFNALNNTVKVIDAHPSTILTQLESAF